MNEHTQAVLEFAAIGTPVFTGLIIGWIANHRRIVSMETKVDAMWQWFLNERLHEHQKPESGKEDKAK